MNKEIIARKNDLLRAHMEGGKVLFTSSVQESEDLQEIVDAVRAFNDFSPDNDPFGEHDFGKIVVNGEEYFWKIDYYDDNYEYFKEDGNRVMTIMRSEEY